MKKIVLAATALVLSAGAAFAENPYVGQPYAQAAQDRAFRTSGTGPVAGSRGDVDYTAPASIRRSAPSTMRQFAPTHRDGSANHFGDASPSSHRK